MHCSESVDSPMDGTQQQQEERRRKKPVYNRSNVEIKEFLFKDASAINAKQYRVLIPAMCQKLTHPTKDVKRSKIKGLWDASNKPSDFPPDLQFRDPNNGEKMPLESMKKTFEYFQQKLLQFPEYSEQDSVRTNSSQLTQSKSTDEPSSELQTMIDSNRNAIRVGDEVKEAQNGTIMNEVEMATGDNQSVCCTDAMSFLHELSVPSITSSGLSSNSEEGSWVNSEISGLTCSKGNEVNQSSLIPFTRVDELTDGMDKATWWQNEPDHSETLPGTVLTFHGNTASQCAQLAHEINSDLKEMQTKFISVYKENHEVKSVIDKMNEEFLAPLFEAASNGSLESCLKYSTICTKLEEVKRKAIYLSIDVVIELKKVIDDVESSTPVTHLPAGAGEVEIQNTAMTDPPTDLSTTDDFSFTPEEKPNDIIAVLSESNSVSCNEFGSIRNNFTDSVDVNNCSEGMEVTTSSEMQVDQLTTCCMTSFEKSYQEQQKHGLTEELENEYPKTNCSTPQVIPSTVLEMAESGDSDDQCSKPKRMATDRRGKFLAPLFEAASNGSLESCLKYSTISTKLQEVMRKAIYLSNDVVIELKKVIDDVESSTPVTHLPAVACEVEIQNTAMTDPPTDLSTTDYFSFTPEEKPNDIIAVPSESNSVSCNEFGSIRNNFTDSVDFNNCEGMEVTTSSEMQVDQLAMCCMTSFEESYQKQQKHGLTEELENEYPKVDSHLLSMFISIL